MTTLLDKYKWLGRVASWSAFSRADIACAFYIVDGFNVRHGYSWPPADFIAQKANIARSSVFTSLKRLEQEGFIKRISGGKGRNNHYFIVWGAGLLLGVDEATEAHIDGSADPSSPPDATRPADKTQPVRCTGPYTSYIPVASSVGDEEVSPPRGRASADAGPPPGGYPSFFDQFWEAYPKKENRKQAQAQFQAAIAKGVAAQVLIGKAAQYAIAKATVQDPRFIKTPGNWLRDECWLEDPQPSQPKKKPVPADRVTKPAKPTSSARRKTQGVSSLKIGDCVKHVGTGIAAFVVKIGKKNSTILFAAKDGSVMQRVVGSENLSPSSEVPSNIIGRRVRHSTRGSGIMVGLSETGLAKVNFRDGNTRQVRFSGLSWVQQP